MTRTFRGGIVSSSSSMFRSSRHWPGAAARSGASTLSALADRCGRLRGVRVGVVPALGREQPPGQRAGGGVGDRADRYPDLAVADLVQGAGVLPGHPGDAVPSYTNPVSWTTHA